MPRLKIRLPFTQSRQGVAPRREKVEMVRRILPILGVAVHGVQGLLYLTLGLNSFLWTSALAVAVFGGCMLLLRNGLPKAAMVVGYVEVAAHCAAIHVILGPDSGFLFYYFCLAASPFLMFRPRDRVERLLGILYPCLATPLLFQWSAHNPPTIPLPAGHLTTLYLFNLVGTLFAIVMIVWYFEAASARLERRIDEERDRAEQLLLNILPAPIAARLKAGQSTIADQFPSVTVLFADIVGFTKLSAEVSTEELIGLLNEIFSGFDELAAKHNLEKIKTIGDAYLVVGGLPEEQEGHASAVARMGLDMLTALGETEAGRDGLQLRVGIHTGPVVAGVIGKKKFAYDLWGDTVNTASRMESHGAPGRVHVSAQTRELLGDEFIFEDRGAIEVKGKGPMRTHFLVG